MTRLIKHFWPVLHKYIFVIEGSLSCFMMVTYYCSTGTFYPILNLHKYTSKSGYQALRDEHYLQFFIARRTSITEVPPLNELYERIHSESRTFTVPRLSKDVLKMITMFKTGPRANGVQNRVCGHFPF
jgi:hypothetical protein